MITEKDIKELMSKWGKKGGKARAAKLSPERRREIAMLGVKARLENKKDKKEVT